MADPQQVREGSAKGPRLSHVSAAFVVSVLPRPSTDGDLRALVERAQRGEEAAFTMWVEHTYPIAFRCVLPMVGGRAEAEDVLQDVFARVWQKLATLQKPASSLPWLLTMCRRAAIDRLRARPKRETSDDAAVALLTAREVPADELLQRQETRAAIADALCKIDDDQRAVIQLRDVEGLTAPEVAALLQVPLGTVESRTHRARQALRKLLGRKR